MDTSSSVDHHLHLPDEIMELILSRCPAESVGRFTSVSKTWQSIISNPRFCRLHYIQQSKRPENQNMFFLFMKDLSDDSSLAYTLLYKTFENGIFERDYPIPRYDPSQGFSPLSSCAGLILLRDNGMLEDKYMLWNPLIEKHIIIPDFTPTSHPQAFTNRPHRKPFYHWLQHLYFDSISNDYKILVAYRNWYALYSCHNGIWGEIKDLPDDLAVYHNTSCVDGCIYDECNGEIICFDTRDGKLHKFPQPKDVEDFVIMELSGCLCLKNDWSDEYGRMLHLWVMEKNGSFEKSWKKLIISMEKEKPDLWLLSPLCLTNDDHVVLSARDKKNYSEDFMYKYNPCGNSFQEIKFPGHEVYVDCCFSYSETLYMPPSNTPPCSDN